MKIAKYLLAAILIPASLWAGTLSGTVSAASGGAPIANALVVLRTTNSATGTVYDSVRSNAAGLYTFSGLSAATYYVTTTATGYVTISLSSHAVTATGTTTYNISMTASVGTITGVARSNGNPIVGLTVTLRRSSATSDPVATTTTDSTGRYTFSNQASGTPNYYVTIFNPATNQTVTNGNLAVTNGGTTTSNFLLSATALQSFSKTSSSMRWSRSGDRLTLDLGASNTTRLVSVYGLNGTVLYSVFVNAGESRAVIPAAFAPSNGYLFQVK